MAIQGLSSAEAQERKLSGKANGQREVISNTYLAILIRNTTTPFNLILLILGAALIICGEYKSAVAATVVIIINIMISTVQEWRAKRRLDKISVLVRPIATVVRDGNEIEIDYADIVLGDTIHLHTGEQALVDGEVLESTMAEMDESLLTGESHTIKKGVGDTIYSGSSCVAGECYFRADKVGDDTYTEKITAVARKFEKKITPVQKETSAVTNTLMIIAFVCVLLSIILNLIRGQFSIDGALKDAVICLDMVPIALFLLISIMYMIAAVRMADSGVLLQNSGSVESMSHVDTLCMDKTGTITTNRLLFENAEYIIEDKDRADRLLRELCGASRSRNRTFDVVCKHFGKAECTLLDETQFSSGRKYSAVRVEADGRTDTIVMGAWNVLRPKSSNRNIVDGIVNSFATQGLRTIVVCDAKGAELHKDGEDVLPDLEPVVVITIRDEIREDCRSIIHEFKDNGIDIKVISGDDPDTINALFDQAKITGERKCLSGEDLDKLSDEEFDKEVLDANIFGRMRPEQKEEVIESLRRSGRYVAMVGDGVNDVRSIKKADIGISMESGTGAARGVADMVLLKDNFRALPKAMVEGQRTVSGLRDILRLYLNRNFTVAALVFLLLIIGGITPMEPIQDTAYSILTVSFAALLITVWAKPTEDRTMLLPKIVRYCVPITICSVLGGLLMVLIGWLLASNGTVDMSDTGPIMTNMHNLVDDIARQVDILQPSAEKWKTEGLINKADTDRALAVGLQYMLNFLIITGISQLLIIFPPFKKLCIDKTFRRVWFPVIILAIEILLYVAMIAIVPWFSIIFLDMIIFDPLSWAIIIGASVVWYFIAIALLKSKWLVYIDWWSDQITAKILKDHKLDAKRVRQKISRK